VGTSLPSLDASLQDAAGARLNDSAVVLGGLNAADTSTESVITIGAGAHTQTDRLPGARHDAAAASIGGDVFVFGGGNGISELSEIVRVESRGSSRAVVGHLPKPSSDVGAAAIAGTAFIVGGYTGTAWLDTIVAWRPGRDARVVAHLPTPLRYAAVSASGGRLVIAGGSLPSGAAGREIYTFDPRTRKVLRIGELPAATTHAAGAALAGLVYVIGGRGSALGTATDRIVSVDPVRRRIRPAGRLPQRLSDATAVSLPGRIVVVGGRANSGTIADVLELRPTGAARTGTPAQVTRATRSNASAAGVYVHDGRNMLSAVTRGMPARIYVPNSLSDTVDVIDPVSFRIISHFAVGALPQHVTPAYDLKTLYVLNDQGNSVTPIDPRTSRPSAPIPVADPYNMYFTPDGTYAIVVAERNAALDFRDPHTFRLHHSLAVPCKGIDHIDFSANGSFLIASCEFSSEIVKVDVRRERVTGSLTIDHGRAMPQDVKLSPDGRVFYIADMNAGGVWEVSGTPLRTLGFLPTGRGAHGLYPSRNARLLYVSNREAGTISVISFATRKVIATWTIPGGSPDMGGVSADGRVLWLSCRYNAEVYAINTATGRLIKRIKVGRGPHGLSVWPQPGRFSLGHTGIMR
jgi:YVTN family beta-propeller protein